MPESINDLYAFDRRIHEPARLAIIAVLWACESADFKYLQGTTGLTKGNLSAQMKKLEKEGYLQITKTFKGSYPNTSAALTKAGRKAFEAYRKGYLKLARELS
jgi:DNA-binding MarR family transcriptional regulator